MRYNMYTYNASFAHALACHNIIELDISQPIFKWISGRQCLYRWASMIGKRPNSKRMFYVQCSSICWFKSRAHPLVVSLHLCFTREKRLHNYKWDFFFLYMPVLRFSICMQIFWKLADAQSTENKVAWLKKG